MTIEYRYGQSLYVIVVHSPGLVRRNGADVILDGQALTDDVIQLVDDGERHEVVVRSRAHALVEGGAR
jgi:hypothetical protein